MTIQAMFDKGQRCKGKGVNCGICKDKNNCVEYVNADVKEKPPLGIMPKEFWDLHRRDDLKDAINRHLNVGKEVPIEWVDEYNSLLNL
ncbi:MAG: hypothetical protein RR645_02970 [Clostridium sp.]